ETFQQRRTASRTASSPSTFRKVSCCPAKLASARSSAVAEERTATGRPKGTPPLHASLPWSPAAAASSPWPVATAAAAPRGHPDAGATVDGGEQPSNSFGPLSS